jgi:hypothetical protein
MFPNSILLDVILWYLIGLDLRLLVKLAFKILWVASFEN